MSQFTEIVTSFKSNRTCRPCFSHTNTFKHTHTHTHIYTRTKLWQNRKYLNKKKLGNKANFWLPLQLLIIQYYEDKIYQREI